MKAWGAIFLIRPDWVGNEEDLEQATVETYEPARSFLRVGPELWRLAGNHERATAIETLLERVHERDDVVMTADEIKELLRLLDGIEDALVGRVVDEQWMVQPEQLLDLRSRTKTLDLDERRGHLALHAVGEGMGNICSLRAILREARDRGLLVALD